MYSRIRLILLIFSAVLFAYGCQPGTGVNTSGLESLTLEYSQGTPRADHHVTFFANDAYGVAFHHYFRAPICLTRDASIEDYKIYEHAVESFKFPP